MSSIYGYYASSISSSSSSSKSLGISGLASGLDIDSIVEAMSSKTTSKISKVQQNLMKLQWKQEAYQDVGAALTDFQSKYLSSSGSSSISKLLTNATKIESSGDNASAVSASGSADILTNFSVLGVSSLASSATFSSSKSVTKNSIESGQLNLSTTGSTVSALEGKSLDIKVGSNSFSLKLDSTKITDSDSMLEAVQKAITEADAGNDVTASLSDGRLVLSSKNGSSNVTIKSSSSPAVLQAFGFGKDDQGNYKNGITITGNQPDFSETTKQVSFFTELRNSNVTLDLDGIKAKIEFSAEDVDAIEAAGDDSAMVDKFVDLFNEKMSKFYGNKVTMEKTTFDNGEDGTGYGFKLSVSEPTSILSVASSSSGMTGESGILGISVGDANRLLTTKTLEESNFAQKFDFGENGDRTYSLNVNGQNFEIGKNSISVNGKSTEFAKGVTMKNVMDTINNSGANVSMKYMSTTDRFVVQSTVTGAAGQIEMSGSFADMIFGDGALTVNESNGEYVSNGSGTVSADAEQNKGGTFTAGTDAKVLVSFDGTSAQEITRSTNSFKVDGLQLNLNKTFSVESLQGKTAGEINASDIVTAKAGGAVAFSRSVDSEEITKAFKEMTDDYNALIDKVVNYYTTKPDKDYEPLTSDMIKAEDLSDEQADLYNDKAKAGILFGDSIFASLLNDINSVFSQTSSIGITPSNDYTQYGKISFDSEKFSNMLKSDGDKVTQLLTGDGSGVSAKLGKLMDKYVSTSLTQPGLITSRAGLKSSSLSQFNSAIFTEMQDAQSQLKTLNTRLKDEQDRYYSRFTQMEKMISQYQAQSAYLGNL